MDRLFFSKIAVLFNDIGISLEEKIERLKAIEAVKNDSCLIIGVDCGHFKEAISFKTLLHNTPGIIKRRSKGMRVIPKTVTNYNGDADIPLINFHFTSVQKTQGKGHNAWVALLDGTSEGRVKVHCACKYFMYTLEVALAHKNASDVIQSNGALPIRRNPSMKAFLCKHLVMAYGYLGILPGQDKSRLAPKYLKTPRHEMSPEEISRMRGERPGRTRRRTLTLDELRRLRGL